MVNRLIEPTSGRILLDGVDAAARDVTELRRGIGYVIQQIGLFPHQTIVDNVGDGAPPARLAGGADQRSAPRSCSAWSGWTRRRYAGRAIPAQLSGGERQRVGVARALAADPPIMLMDEPFGAVDPIVRERLQNEFLRLQEELAKTILFVTHDIDEAIKMGDLVAVFAGGRRVAQFGPPARDPGQPGLRLRRPLRGRRPRPQAAVAHPRSRSRASNGDRRRGSATPAGQARERAAADPFPYLLLVDAGDRPIGWLGDPAIRGRRSADRGDGDPDVAAPVDRETTLKDALSMLLDADVHAGIVVDPRRPRPGAGHHRHDRRLPARRQAPRRSPSGRRTHR